MPYALRGTTIINRATGEEVKRHPNRKAARAHLRALYANVADADHCADCPMMALKANGAANAASAAASAGASASRAAAQQSRSSSGSSGGSGGSGASSGQGYSARGGGQIRGNLCRSPSGSFVACGAGGGSSSRSGSSGGRSSRSQQRQSRAAAPKKTEAQREAERQERARQREEERKQEQRENREKVGAQSGLGESLHGALLEFSSPDENIQLAPQNAAELEKRGLVDRGPNGEYRMTAAGRAYVSAADSGDVRRASDALSRGNEQATGRQQRENERQQRQQQSRQRQQERDARRQQQRQQREQQRQQRSGGAAGGGGGGGGGSGGAEQREAQRKQEQRENREKVGAQSGLGESLHGALLEFSSPDENIQLAPQNAAELEKRGLVDRGPNGEYGMTPAGRAYVSAADKGDVRRASDALLRGSEQVSNRQQREQQGQQREQQREQQRQQREQQREQQRQQREQQRQQPTIREGLRNAADKLSNGEQLSADEENDLIRNGLARRDREGSLVLTATGLRATRKEGNSNSVMMVFKDAQNQLRWLAVSSTAFKDRDNEIVSLAALEKDIARTYKTGRHGPLRWWHIGKPDPLNPEKPWGPGVDLGQCDYRALIGRSLIESGTFYSEKHAALVAENDQMSLGFFHPWNEPGEDRIFDTIYSFERSVTPGGRAANPFTKIITEGDTAMTVLTKEKRDEFIARGGDPELLESLILNQERVEKEADAHGVAFKAFDPAQEAAIKSLLQSLLPSNPQARQALESLGITVKEDGAELDAVAMEEEAPLEDAPTEEAPAEDGMVYVGDMTPDEFKAILVAAFQEAMSPLTETLNIETKLRGALDEMKDFVGGYTAKKDDESSAQAAAQAAELDSLRSTLKSLQDQQSQAQLRLNELLGEQPRAYYRATADSNNVIATKEAEPTQDPFAPHINAITAVLSGQIGSGPFVVTGE